MRRIDNMSKKHKLKDACFKCGTFDPKKTARYKCAVTGSCAGKDWSMSKKQHLIKEREEL
jgi:hypothetical protein